jgi:hypothetical protein
MAVNQSQVDHIITAASEDDPEVKLQNLEREVDLIKTSIKRLLMDIRERMNELENPFTIVSSAGGAMPTGASASMDSELDHAKKAALEAREAALDARESQMDATKAKIETEKKAESPAARPEPVHTPYSDERKTLDDQILAALRAQVSTPVNPLPQLLPLQAAPVQVAPAQKSTAPSPTPAMEKIRLQKVYKLFKWTHQSVRKYGHDRLEIILESYRAMGYIAKESCDEIREISRLMPANLGEEHEVGPDEFVAELYALNRILAPNDTSLDRDMIEVMMEQRQQQPSIKENLSEARMNLAPVTVREPRLSVKNKEKDDEWMNLPDRI